MPNITVIPAAAPITSVQSAASYRKRRVAAYARVSTDNDEQLTSYEAQVDYYTKFIHTRADWEFVTVYTDEGISAVNTKKRDGFNQMIADALAGKIDLIVTKSVSRFARNTVDSLTTVRKLKDKGVEVWFEKENIYTLDSKGELLITIMSSLAQEESRSISENVTWGHRKRMADGRVSFSYGNFLGYKKGDDGKPTIVEEEARIVRLIYRLFIEGKTFSAIAKQLTTNGIPTPGGKRVWQAATVRSILTNEKYKGHALLQKTYCENFLTKKMVKNTGQVQQYYVEDSHPAIIDPEEYDAVQAEIQRRNSLGTIGRCSSALAGKIICADCGGIYGRKVWGSYKDDKSGRREVYRCNDKYRNKHKGLPQCQTGAVAEAEIKARFLTAFNQLLGDRANLIEDCQLAQCTIANTKAIDAELAELRREVEVVTELHRKAIQENATTTQDQAEFHQRSDGYVERHRVATDRISELEAAKQQRQAQAKTLKRFIKDIEKQPLAISEFDEALWLSTMDKVIVTNADGDMIFTFRDGTEIAVTWDEKCQIQPTKAGRAL